MSQTPRTPNNSTHSQWLILAAIGTGTLMTALDGSIVNTLLPVLRQQFSVDVATIEWVVTTYLLVASSLLLSFGRLGDLYGHKRTYLLGFAVFLLSSIACGLARSAGMLVGARGVQAIGAAMLARQEITTPGVYAPEGIIAPAPFFQALAERGIPIHRSEDALAH